MLEKTLTVRGISRVALNMISPCTSALPSNAQIQLGQGGPCIRDLASFYFCLNFIPFIYWLVYSCVLWHEWHLEDSSWESFFSIHYVDPGMIKLRP